MHDCFGRRASKEPTPRASVGRNPAWDDRSIHTRPLRSVFIAAALIVPVALAACGNDEDSAPTTTASTIEPAIKKEPTAGACGLVPGNQAVGVIHINPDTPQPRCLESHPGQRLRLVNRSGAFGQEGQEVTVSIAAYHAKLAPGQGVTFDKPVGSFLAPGDHLARISLYRGGGAEVLVRAG